MNTCNEGDKDLDRNERDDDGRDLNSNEGIRDNDGRRRNLGNNEGIRDNDGRRRDLDSNEGDKEGGDRDSNESKRD